MKNNLDRFPIYDNYIVGGMYWHTLQWFKGLKKEIKLMIREGHPSDVILEELIEGMEID